MPWPVEQVELPRPTKTYSPRGLLKNRIPKMLVIGSFEKQKIGSFEKQKNGQPMDIGWLR
jgi:hypothetical protein